jgi:hypothetical protein
MFHEEDIVEEIATGRLGKIDQIGCETSRGHETQTQWHVVFSDTRAPGVSTFVSKAQLRLVRCPHSDPRPGVSPAEPLA